MFLAVAAWCACALVGVASCGERPVRVVAQGSLEGVYLQTRRGRTVEAYTTIPYAQPPLAELRFKAPVPASKWSGTLDASKKTPFCVQRNPYVRQQGIHGQEDCLYLSVYVPATADAGGDGGAGAGAELPVMVWFHGGGLMCGAGVLEMYGPAHLLDRDVVLVTTNYRLGPLGFLSTMDEHCPGNNGLKDQQEALRWVSRNIHHFGGNNRSVTLFGESAGGASVHLHMLSPTSAGLFHKAISQSGTAMVPWANAPPGEALRQARTLARLTGCPFTPSPALLACLRTKTAEELIDTEFSFYFWDYDQMTIFKPVAEPALPGAFITEDPRRAPDVPAVPWMTGLTTDEGCLKSTWLLNNSTLMSEFSSGFDSIAPVTFYYENSPDVEGITAAIQDFYFDGKRAGKIGADDKRGLIDVYTDSYFAYGLIEALRVHLSYSRQHTFLYQLSYRATNSFSQIFGDPTGNHGVCHADDLIYLFPIDFLQHESSAADQRVLETMLDIWTNFAATGNPNSPSESRGSVKGWSPVSNMDTLEYMDIGAELKMSKDLARRARFWDMLPLWHSFRKFHPESRHIERNEL